MKSTKIQWCDCTFNHVIGCRKVSPGCQNCYAETYWKRFRIKTRIRTSTANWREPVKWNAHPWICDACGAATCVHPDGGLPCGPCGSRAGFHRVRVFCASLADWLDDADVVMPDGRIDRCGVETMADLLHLIRKTPNLDWLLLTKRPENWRNRIEAAIGTMHCDPLDTGDVMDEWLRGNPPRNVWLGVSAENQEWANKRIPILLEIPARIKFVSVEPMLGPINFKDVPNFNRVSLSLHNWWVIFGGESGAKARPCNVDWIRDGVRQCREAGVAAFVKQLGAVSVISYFEFMKPGQYITVEDGVGVIHTMKITKVREDNRTVTGEIAVYPSKKHHPVLKEVTVRAHQICWPIGTKLIDHKGGDPAEWSDHQLVREWPGGGR